MEATMEERKVGIQESQRQLLWLERLLEEKPETIHLAKRIAGLRLYQQGYPVTEIASILGMSTSWMHRQLQRYRDGGLPSVLQWRGRNWKELLQHEALTLANIDKMADDVENSVSGLF